MKKTTGVSVTSPGELTSRLTRQPRGVDVVGAVGPGHRLQAHSGRLHRDVAQAAVLGLVTRLGSGGHQVLVRLHCNDVLKRLGRGTTVSKDDKCTGRCHPCLGISLSLIRISIKRREEK